MYVRVPRRDPVPLAGLAAAATRKAEATATAAAGKTTALETVDRTAEEPTRRAR